MTLNYHDLGQSIDAAELHKLRNEVKQQRELLAQINYMLPHAIAEANAILRSVHADDETEEDAACQ